MKNLHLIIVNIFLSVNLFSQIQSDYNVPSNLMSVYKWDVVDLSLNRMYEIKSPDTVQILIPEAYQDTIWHGLSAIFNAFNIPERDSVFDNYCIHRHLAYYMISNSITIKIDPNFAWTNNWKKLQITTGYNELDNYLSEYDFKIDRINILNYADFSTDRFINTKAFCDSLKNFEGILAAESCGYGGDGNCISYKKTGDEQFFDFSIGWGDCLSGCINRYFYRFKVNYIDSNVEYLGNGYYSCFHEDLPTPANCNITGNKAFHANTEIEIKLYPNPAKDILYIEAEDIKQVDIFTLTGKHLKNIKCNEIHQYHLDGFSAGIYLVKIITDHGLAVEKLIWEE